MNGTYQSRIDELAHDVSSTRTRTKFSNYLDPGLPELVV